MKTWYWMSENGSWGNPMLRLQPLWLILTRQSPLTRFLLQFYQRISHDEGTHRRAIEHPIRGCRAKRRVGSLSRSLSLFPYHERFRSSKCSIRKCFHRKEMPQGQIKISEPMEREFFHVLLYAPSLLSVLASFASYFSEKYSLLYGKFI